jgi:hypothetical protein
LLQPQLQALDELMKNHLSMLGSMGAAGWAAFWGKLGEEVLPGEASTVELALWAGSERVRG